MTWTTLTMQVTTPLFNGGADAGANDGTGVRASSIRGVMRFWFRALAGALTGPDLRLLATLEHRIFGGIGSEDTGGASASPLLLRISRQPAVTLPAGRHSFLPSPTRPLNDRRRADSRWILYLMGQGLADLGKVEIRRPYVAPGQDFEVKVSFRHLRHEDTESRAAIEALALASLWLACAYGGIGARTRRGLGGVRITGASGAELPEPWTRDDALLTPGLDYYTPPGKIWLDEPVASCMRYFTVLARGARLNRRAWDGIPAFPVLSPSYAPAGTRGGEPFRSWEYALIQAGKELRHFRAAQPNASPSAHYKPLIETPEWITTVHGRDSRYPVGALGLPVVMKDNYVANADGGDAAEPTRRASPLWIRAVGAGREWRLLSFAFQAEFLPGSAHLWHHSRQGKELQITDHDVKRQTDQWIKALREGKTFVPHPHDDGTLEPDERRSTGDLRR